MRVTIAERGQAPQDVTERLFESTPVVLDQERERTAFKRVVSDLRVTLSNLDGAITSLLASRPATTHWMVEVFSETRKLFKGEIDLTSSPIDVDEESATMNVFSIDRLFWNLASTSRLFYPLGSFEEGGKAYVTVRYVLEREFTHNSGIHDLFSGIAIDPLYENRPIRGWMDAAASGDPTIGNNGRYRELSPTTTIQELLQAMAVYYNAEFFVDPATDLLTMRRRLDVLDDRGTEIDDLIVEDRKPSVFLLDDDKYDWIQVAFAVPKPPAPKIVGATAAARGRGVFEPLKYRMTNVTSGGAGLTIESDAGTESQYVNLPSGATQPLKIELTLPLGPDGTTSRRLWRQDWTLNYDGDGNPVTPKAFSPYYLVAEIADNATTDFFDDYPFTWAFGGQKQLPPDTVNGETWFGYDEETQTWLPPIRNDGTSSPPDGRILDVTPKLRFVSAIDRNTELAFNVLDVIAFFGGKKDFSLSNFRDQWLPIFIKRLKAQVGLIGLDYAVGDSMTVRGAIGSYRATPGTRFAVKRAAGNLNSEETDLTIITAFGQGSGGSGGGGGGGGGGFDDLVRSIPNTLLFWAKARAMTGLSDGDETNLTDFGGLGNHATNATPARKALWKISQVNGLPSFRFDGARWVTTTATPADTGYTIVVVFKRKWDSGASGLGLLGRSNYIYWLLYPSGAGLGLANGTEIAGGNGTLYQDGHDFVGAHHYVDTWEAATYVRAMPGGSGELKYNSVSAGTYGPGSFLGFHGITIGAYNDVGGLASFVDVPEVLIWDGVVSPANLAAIDSGIRSLYAI